MTRTPATAPRVTITTPLTGWTPCAGERGTEPAVALALAAAFARDSTDDTDNTNSTDNTDNTGDTDKP